MENVHPERRGADPAPPEPSRWDWRRRGPARWALIAATALAIVIGIGAVVWGLVDEPDAVLVVVPVGVDPRAEIDPGADVRVTGRVLQVEDREAVRATAVVPARGGDGGDWPDLEEHVGRRIALQGEIEALIGPRAFTLQPR